MSATRFCISASLFTLLTLFGHAPHAFAGDDLAKIDGRVILNGKPLSGGRIFFYQQDGQFAGAKTDREGKFKVDRIPVGPHKVTVEFAGLPDKYASEEHTQLRVDVTREANTFSFELVSK